jgi:hypothetical protein
VLEKDDRTTTLSLPLPSGPAAVAQDEVDDDDERSPRGPGR